MISLLSLSTISAGVPLGAPMPCQTIGLVARHELVHRRNVRQRIATRVALVTASARSWPARMYAIVDGHGVEHDLHLPAEQIGHRSSTAIGHVHHVDAGHHLEQLAGHVGRGADAGRRHS